MLNRSKEKWITQYILEYRGTMYRLAYSYVKNENDALDIVQESIYKALTSVEQLREPSAIKTWMYRIVINTALDYLRKNSKYVYDETLNMDEGRYDEYEDTDLKEALEELVEPYKTIVKLRYFEDLKISEIAKVMEENENTIKTRLYTALKKLRIQIEGGQNEKR